MEMSNFSSKDWMKKEQTYMESIRFEWKGKMRQMRSEEWRNEKINWKNNLITLAIE